jgi:hypothetical protein
MNLSLFTSQRGIVVAAAIVLAELAVGFATSAASPANASPMNFSGQADSVELAEQPSVSQMAKDDEDKTDKDDDDDDDDKQEAEQADDDDTESVPQSCRDAVFKDATKKSGTPASKLRIVKAERQTWSNGCLGLESPGTACTQARVPGWRIVVASGEESWVYRTNASGSFVKLDEVATQTLARQSTTQTTSRREVITRTTQTNQSVTGTASQSGSSQSTQATQSVTGSTSQSGSSQSTEAVMGSTETMEGVSTETRQQARIARSSAQVNFNDISESYWARDFIAELAKRGIMTGFPDGKFHPNEPVTRAQFAAILASVFKNSKVRNAINFKDVSTGHWAYYGIREAYEMGFLGSISGNQFKPNQSLTRLQIMTALMKALNYTSSNSTQQVLQFYSDAAAIPAEARSLVAAATERGIVANYPNVRTCSPNQVATRADVAAFLYQAMVSKGDAVAISSPYVVEKGVEVREAGEVRQVDDADDEVGKPRQRQNCNQGIGNGAEGCDPGNSRPHGGSNDEGGRTPGNRPK